MNLLLGLRAAIVSLALLGAMLFMWHDATRGAYPAAPGSAAQGKPAMPGPLDVGARLLEQLRDPLGVGGPKNKALILQAGYSVAHAAAGYLPAMLIAIPLGFLIGASSLMKRSLEPFIQLLKPVSLAWMPLALYLFKDSSSSVILVIFTCALWPMLIDTAAGVSAVRRDWVRLARTLEVGRLRRARTIVMPAAAPDIFAGMRMSAGIAWIATIGAEMLVGGNGIGAFLWNEWRSLAIANVILATLTIGVVGVALDYFLAHCARSVSYRE